MYCKCARRLKLVSGNDKGWHNWTAYLLVWVVSFCHKFSCRQCPRIPVVFPGGVPDILLVCNKENTEYNKDTDFCMLVFGVPNLAFSGSSVGFFWYAVKREKLTGEFVYDIAVVTHCWKWTLNQTPFFSKWTRKCYQQIQFSFLRSWFTQNIAILYLGIHFNVILTSFIQFQAILEKMMLLA